MKIYNTLVRKNEEFVPLHDRRVGLYTCGPTVYNYAHIGNLRTYVFEDVLRRTLTYFGYRVKQVMNITDVGHLTDDADEGEDKMTKSAREKKKSVWEIAEFYTDAFFEDTDKLNIERPEIACRATEHIDEMIALVERLEAKGYTYESGGNIYFDISRVEDYGKLALLDRQELLAGARVDVDQEKKNPHDFVLWFTRSKFEHQAMLWDSPWGKGYPGWHLECSAMSMKYLGEQFDIHCGGIDHIPVHHTNEIAQSEAATGKKSVNYWMHAEFLLMRQGKMAKSKGNFITLRSLEEEGYHPLDYRYFCLGAHYRSQLQFSLEGLDAARNARENLVERVGELAYRAGGPDGVAGAELGGGAGSYLEAFEEHIGNDLNMPQALADLWGLVKATDVSDDSKYAAILRMDRVLGLKLEEASKGEEEPLDGESLDLIRSREFARKKKDFRKADEIRGILLEKGIRLKDTPEGTEWERIK
ncbi:MAG: cysteine--tRNA ligase [Spirochaetota bacterium]